MPKKNNLLDEILKKVSYGIYLFDNNQLLAGILILLLNYGGKYAVIEFSKTQEEYLRNTLSKQLIIFAMVWTTTRNLLLSILLTASFVILSDVIINPESSLCILPSKYKHLHKLEKEGKFKKDEIVTSNDIEKAKKVLKKAEAQNKKLNYLEHFTN
jgi:hypothetical protein|tara:strand:+ start:335 stop:802 length:468 start_codon:yes stop_codon:yes gene_type:complete